MFTSYNVEYYVYQPNTTINMYQPVAVSHSYPYMMGINLIFSALCLLFGMFDLFDKYGKQASENAGQISGSQLGKKF